MVSTMSSALVLVIAFTLQTALGMPRSLIKVDAQKTRSDDVDPDEYLWETLPGRCCFNQLADACDTCTVWSTPENFCHTSRENCELCGMSTYCDPPPPLLDANKICTGTSQVGKGCFDDLGTGYCQKSGALASCQAACRKTEHCEMIALYIDDKAGSCVLCRNLLEFEETQGIAVRVYAVEELEVGPPSPPGHLKDDGVHFSIISDPSPPPPPLPPPRPPRSPPPPLPAALGSRADTHIDCEFFEGMDFSLKKDVQGEETDLVASTAKHCCSLCGTRAGCTDFVFEPASGICVLLPHLLTQQLEKEENPSTIAGSVTITRPNTHHASCHFDVGSGYTGGVIGLGKPLPGQIKMTSRQDCCDACEKEPDCSKFTYEKYGGVCEMHSSIAERYYTSGLMSGTLDNRIKPLVSKIISQLEASSAGDLLGNLASNQLPPTPPLFEFDSAPPLPPPEGDAESSQDMLAYVSLAAIGMMGVAMALCTYLFFATEINSILFNISFGKLGRKPKSLLPVQTPLVGGYDIMDSQLKLGCLEPGWAKVTVQTAQVTQKKEMEIAGCRSQEELRKRIADEFGHLLHGINPKSFTLMAWVKEEEEDGMWMRVSSSSDMNLVCRCSAIKLALNGLVQPSELRSGSLSSRSGKGKAGSRKGIAAVLKNGETGSQRTRHKRRTASPRGFQCISSDSPTEGSDASDDDPLCERVEISQSNGMPKGRQKSGCISNGHKKLLSLIKPGTRVQLQSLVDKAHLNGRCGVVLGHDPKKGRYRVQLQAEADQPALVMAFKVENLLHL